MSKTSTIREVIVESAKQLKMDNQHLILLHQGSRLSDNVSLEHALPKAQATVLFLQVASVLQKQSSSVESTSNPQGDYNGYCRSCGMVSSLRPILICSQCRMSNFTLQNPVNYFTDDLDLIYGSCNQCGNNVKPIVKFQCRKCFEDVPLLRQLRENIHKLPCMKCGEKDELVMLFCCSSRHTMCTDCFIDMCRMKLVSNGFKNFDILGYSLPCPGPGVDCSQSPIADPHHFYLIDGKEFYGEFQNLALKSFLATEGMSCGSCNTTINFNAGQDAEVTLPPGTEPTAVVAGGAWSFLSRLFKRTQEQPVPLEKKLRKQVMCNTCRIPYCCECRQQWHEGECVKLSPEEEAAAKKFEIDMKKAAASCWPKNS